MNLAKRRLFLNADKTKVVAENDAEAAFLLAGKGSEIPAEYAELAAAYEAQYPAEAEGEAASSATGEEAADEGGKKSGKKKGGSNGDE